MVRREDALSVPDSLPLTTAQPGIFTKDLSGSGQGIVVKSDMLTLAEPRTLAPRNEVIVLDATGLGPVTPAVRASEPAPFSPLSTTVNLPDQRGGAEQRDAGRPGPGNRHRDRTAEPSGDHRGALTAPPRLENRTPNGIPYLS